MFWGLIMEPGKKYSQTVEKSFHVSHAALDLDSAQVAPVQVLLGFENRNYLLCTLNKDKWVQVPLDLNFHVGDKVSFATNGPGHVHLTGYLIPEDMFDLEEEEDVEEEEDDEAIPELMPTNSKKRKSDVKNENKNKKVKSETAQLLEETFDDSDDEDDSDVNLTDLLDQEDGDDDEEVEEEEAEDDDSDDEADDDDDDDDDDAEESEEEAQPEPVPQKQKKEKPKQNGVVKSQEKQKGDKSPKANKQTEKPQKADKSPKQKGGRRTITGGVIVEDLKVGEGAPATVGKQVAVFYEGRLQSNNKVFDSTKKGNGFKFRLGKQEVIKGWDVGVVGMKVGGKRRITCPPHMAYGTSGSPPVIPPQSTLVFEVELKNVK